MEIGNKKRNKNKKYSRLFGEAYKETEIKLSWVNFFQYIMIISVKFNLSYAVNKHDKNCLLRIKQFVEKARLYQIN